nr:adenylyltransferase/cytidyltransferase family protein [Cellulomonas endophytica]
MTVRVMTYGTFDLLHVGHVSLLSRARALGDELVVAVSTDEFNATKGKGAYFPWSERAAMVAALRCVDRVVPEHRWEQKAHDVVRLGVDVLVMGDDWVGRFDELRALCDVVYLPRTPGISTTRIKQDLVA